MKRVLLSIIIPVRNNPDISRAIDSVLKYKNSSMELIVMDGASNDSTVNIVKGYGEKIDIFISEPDKGIGDAFNKAIRFMHGDWAFFLASDDELLCDPMKIIEKYNDGICDLICGHIILSDNYGGYLLSRSEHDLSQLDYRCSLRHPATFFRKTVFDKYGYYDTSLICAMDRELFIRFREQGAVFSIINEYITLFRLGGISTKDPIKYAAKEDVYISDQYKISKVKSRILFVEIFVRVWGGKLKRKLGLRRKTLAQYVNKEELNRKLQEENSTVRLE